VSSTFFELISSLFICAPLTLAKGVEISAKEMQTRTDISEYKGSVKIFIPAGKITEISAIERQNLGDTSICKGEVAIAIAIAIAIDGMKIRLDAGVVYKTVEGWVVTTGYAKLSPIDTVI
jgi:hypothetical protein